MVMQGRSYTAGGGDYRFGYQGSEKETGVAGMYTTEYRALDVRLGRWFMPDPITHPWQSPYCSMDNNPIALTDAMGLSTIGDNCGGSAEISSDIELSPGTGGAVEASATVNTQESSVGSFQWGGQAEFGKGNSADIAYITSYTFTPGSKNNGKIGALEFEKIGERYGQKTYKETYDANTDILMRTYRALGATYYYIHQFNSAMPPLIYWEKDMEMRTLKPDPVTLSEICEDDAGLFALKKKKIRTIDGSDDDDDDDHAGDDDPPPCKVFVGELKVEWEPYKAHPMSTVDKKELYKQVYDIVAQWQKCNTQVIIVVNTPIPKSHEKDLPTDDHPWVTRADITMLMRAQYIKNLLAPYKHLPPPVIQINYGQPGTQNSQIIFKFWDDTILILDFGIKYDWR